MLRLRALLCVLGTTLPAAAAEPSGATLWLRGDYLAERGSAFGRSAFTGMLGLSVPWERTVAPRAPGALAQNARSESSDTELVDEPATDSPPQTEPEGNAARHRSKPRGEPAQRPRAREPEREPVDEPRKAVLTPALVRETLKRALRAQGFGEDAERLNSLRRRARWSAVLPELRLRAARGTDQSLRLNPTIDDPYRYTQDGGTDVLVEARLSWSLSKLLFATPEVALERLRLLKARRKSELERRVLEALFDWQRAHFLVESDEAFFEQRQEAELERSEAELSLNVLTSGWFTTERAASYRRAAVQDSSSTQR